MTLRTLATRGVLAAGAALTLMAGFVAAPSAAQAAPETLGMGACAQMGGNVTILGERTSTCTLLYTSGSASVLLPQDTPRIKYGVVQMVSPGVAPTTFTDRNGVSYPLNPTEGKRWLSVGPRVAAQTIVAAEIVNKRIGKTFPFLFITDDAITDRFAGKTFFSRTSNAPGSKSPISIWTRIDWSPGMSQNGGLHGVIANYKINVLDTGQCRPAMLKQHTDMVKQRFGKNGKVELSWNPGLYKGADSRLVLSTQTSATFSHPAPTALLLTQKVWKPGKIFFTLDQSDTGLAKIRVESITGGSVVKRCAI